MTDNRHNRIRHIRLIDIEIRTGEESSDCSTQQQRSYYPINYQESPTETGTVKQRERSKESTSERYQRSKRKLPLTSGRVHHHLTMFLRLTQTEQ